MKQQKNFLVILFGAFTILLFNYCSKNSLEKKDIDALTNSKNMNAQTTLVDPDIYLVGWDQTGTYNSAKYWKNGVEYTLSSFYAQAFAIAISGNDIYIGGHIHDTAVYWKNGVRYNLPKAAGWSSPIVKGITVSGGQVYATGVTSISGANYAVYWSPTGYGILPTGNPYGGNSGAAISVSGSDVHIAGWYSNGGAYWKNGVMTSPTSSYVLRAMALNGSDIYFAGQSTMSQKPAYWKNGILTTLPTGGLYPSAAGEATGIAINGVNVYASGYTYSWGAQYWLNGYIGILPSQSENSVATCIAVNGSDVYVGGYDYVGADIYSMGKYWKNGVAYALTTTDNNVKVTAIALK